MTALDWAHAWQFAIKTVRDAHEDFGEATARHVAGNWEKTCKFDAERLLALAGVSKLEHELP